MEQENQLSLPHGYVLHGEKNRYVIDRVLGQGSFGITYLAKCKTTFSGSMGTGTSWTQVAVKEFFMRDLNTRDGSTGFLNDSSQDSIIGKYRRAFVREARNLARLSHPGIVNVFEVIETNNTVYIVMEYIDGGSLDEYISSKGRLTERESLTMFCGICSAVGFMHSHRMLHLDIKPKNIMLDEERHPLLIDFGLSKQYTENGEPESSTSIGLGTPGYAPIEQAERTDSDTSFRPAIDIYALGATLYKMLTGSTPPLASKVSESVLEGENLIPSTLKGQGISDSTAALVTKAMWPSSRKRYQSTAEIMTAIEGILRVEDNIRVGTFDPTIIEPKAGKSLATCVNDNMSYSEAFASARNEVGVNGAFVWHGQVYSTCYAGEWNGLSHEDQDTISLNATSASGSSGTGISNGHEWVDLGLSVKWGTCNVGATKPEECGDYYAWGEIETKKEYSLYAYKYVKKGGIFTRNKYLKYNTDNGLGMVDNKKKLESVDDVACFLWGDKWRMPTDEEFRELIENCKWTWTTQNGINGYMITSKRSGYENQSIFLPLAGCRLESNLYGEDTFGCYWSSMLTSYNPYFAQYLYFNSSNQLIYNYSRFYGRSVRSVCP